MPDSTWIKRGSEANIKKTFGDIALDWIRNNKQAAIGAGGILFAIAVISVFFYINYNKNSETAQKQLFIAQQMAAGGRTDDAIKQLDEIEKAFPNKPEADFAIFTKGDIQFARGDYQAAAKEYEKILSRKTNMDLLPYASFSIAKCSQAAEDYAGAIIKLKDFITAYPEHFLAGQAYVSLAYSYEKTGDKNSAAETYEKIMVLFPETGWAQLAKQKLSAGQPQPPKAARK